MRYTFADLVAAAEAIDAVERLKAELAEFAAEHFGDDDEQGGIVSYLDIATGDSFNVPFDEAIAYFRGKGLQTTFSYKDMIGRAHDQAFTVAKMMDTDMLKQVRDSLDSALANGESFQDWKRTIEPVLQSGGWWGKKLMQDPLTGEAVNAQLGSAWRLETIFRTNMQTAYSSGQWEQIKQQADIAPFIMYDAVDDFRTRPEHRALDGTVLPAKDKFWHTHTPPLGWNCRCGLIQLSEDDLREFGMSVRPPPETGTYQWTNPRTEETIEVPNGVDPGFGRIPTQHMAELRTLLLEKGALLPPEMISSLALSIKRDLPGTKLPDQLAADVSRLRTAQTAYRRVFNEEPPDPLGVDPLAVAQVIEQAIVDREPIPAAFDWRGS
jgi:SPP1 gp7 family putative phage head morphogenesis protein